MLIALIVIHAHSEGVIRSHNYIVTMNASGFLQPLSITTDIIYDLDMSRFPGLDDPLQMFQPSLVIATEESHALWLSALKESSTKDDENSQIESDDLFLLIESCTTDEFGQTPNSGEELEAFQELLDDVVDSTSHGDFSNEEWSFSDFTENSFSSVDSTECLFEDAKTSVTPKSPSYDVTSECYHCNSRDKRSQKRERDSENDCESKKKLKTAETLQWWSYTTDIWDVSHNSTLQPCEFNREC